MVVILLGGGSKKRQQHDIENAKAVWDAYTKLGERGKSEMALTKDFRDTVRERAQRQPAFRKALLREALDLIYNGDFPTGRIILRNYIHATIGFSELSRATNIPSPSLQRMFGPSGNPRAKNFFAVIAHLQRKEGVHIALKVQSA